MGLYSIHQERRLEPQGHVALLSRGLGTTFHVIVIISEEQILLLVSNDDESVLLLEGFPVASSCLSSDATTSLTLAPVRATVPLSRGHGTNKRVKTTQIENGNH